MVEANSTRWNLTTHSGDANMYSLVNLGTKPATNVRVKLLDKGRLRRPCGKLAFGRIDPGSAVNVHRFSADLNLPRWDRVIVTWREGWFPRRRLQWDSQPSATKEAAHGRGSVDGSERPPVRRSVPGTPLTRGDAGTQSS